MSFLERIKLKARPAQDARDKSDVRSIDRLLKTAKERPGDWTVRNELADALAQAGRIEDAVTLLCSIGDQLATDGFTAKSLAVYKKAVRLQPHNEYASHRLEVLTTERINQSAPRLSGAAVAGASAVEPPATEPAAPPHDEQEHSGKQTADEWPAQPAAVDAAGADTPSADAVTNAAEFEEVHLEAAVESNTLAATDSLSDVDPMSEPEPIEDLGANDAPLIAAHHDCDSEVALSSSQPAVEDAPRSVESMLRAAEDAAWSGSADTAIELLKACIRTYPERVEPVAMLADVAQNAGDEETAVDAQARLCDLHCRAEDYASARRIAAALAAKYPDNARHRARLEFISEVLGGEPSEPSEIVALDAAVGNVCDDVAEATVAQENPIVETTIVLDEPCASEAVVHPAEAESDGQPDEMWDPASAGLVENDSDISEVEFARALTDATMGDDAPDRETLVAARTVLTRAASLPRYRLIAARQLSQLDMDAGDFSSALAWLEWAFGGILAPSDEEDLAYEMGIVLERAGESDRALGVFQEVFAKAGPDYRDVAVRIRQLSAGETFNEASQEQSVAC